MRTSTCKSTGRFDFKNPVFIAQLTCAVVMPLITGMGCRS